MSERRRSLFVLLIVVALIGGSIAVVATKDTILGLDLQGGSQLVYKASPTPQQPVVDADAMQRVIDLMQERVNEFGVSEAEVLQSGQDQIEVNVPGVSDAGRLADQVGSTAQLFFYDWEANILDEDCKTDADVNANQRSPINTLHAAVTQASKCKDVGVGKGSDPLASDSPGGESQAAADPRFYVFNKQNRKPLADGQTFDTRQAALDALKPSERAGAEVIEVPAGVLVLREQRSDDPDAPKPDRWWVVQDRPSLSGTDIKSPEQSVNPSGQPNVTFNFTDQGRDAFQAVTRRVAERGVDNAFGQDPQSTSQHFAIALDDELVSAPLIDWRQNPDGIDGSTGAEISGSFTIQSAQDLAKILKIGALPLELNEVSRSQVSASLGKQALDQGLKAGIAGFIIVALFLILYYRVLGVIATVALCIYALYFYAVVKLIPITLTLPGIAGLVLTLGVAADANIVVFERIKEEVRAGRPIPTAITTGYRKGLTAIIDANIVTFLVAFILFIIATAGVQGFAFTLGIGVILSLFTAVLATQAILYSLRGTRLIRSRAALGAGEQRIKFKIDYMGKAKWFFSMSGVILLVCALAMSGRGINFGIDFEGGTRITAPLGEAATVDQVRDAVAPLGLADAKIQTLENEALGTNVVQISTEELAPDEVDAVNQRLDDRFGNENAERGVDRPELRRDRRQLGDPGGHHLAARHLDLHLAAVRDEDRGAGADRVDARHPDRGGRLRPRWPGGDDVDGRGAPDDLGLLALRHDHRVRPNQRERPTDAERGVLADRQPLAVRGHRPLAGDQLLHAAAGARAAAVRRRDAAGLRVRAADRHRVRHVLVDLHRDAGAPALEGARAGLPRAARADRADARRGAGLRDDRAGRPDRRRSQGAQGPPRQRPARPAGVGDRVPGDGQGSRGRGRGRGDRRAAAGRGRFHPPGRWPSRPLARQWRR